MNEYIIKIDEELDNMLYEQAKKGNTTIEEFIIKVLSRFAPLVHIINQEEMARGYEEMAQINLSIAK